MKELIGLGCSKCALKILCSNMEMTFFTSNLEISTITNKFIVKNFVHFALGSDLTLKHRGVVNQFQPFQITRDEKSTRNLPKCAQQSQFPSIPKSVCNSNEML